MSSATACIVSHIQWAGLRGMYTGSSMVVVSNSPSLSTYNWREGERE